MISHSTLRDIIKIDDYQISAVLQADFLTRDSLDGRAA